MSLTQQRSLAVYAMAALIPVYALLNYGGRSGELAMPVATGLAALTYFVSICVYYSVARLALAGHTILLWVSAAAAVILGFFLVGSGGVWSVLTEMGMVLFGSFLIGRLTGSGYPQSRVFITASLAVVLFGTGNYWPIWGPLMEGARELTSTAVGNMEGTLMQWGYSPEMATDLAAQSGRMFGQLIRLIPAFTLLAVLAPFTVGYLWFVYRTDRTHPALAVGVPFVYWRVPFGFTPVVIGAALARLLGGEALQLVADNVLVVLSVYYGAAGLALVEYYLRRLRISRLLKVFFYLLLFLTGLAGYLACAVLGFADSFADWRSRAEAADAED